MAKQSSPLAVSHRSPVCGTRHPGPNPGTRPCSLTNCSNNHMTGIGQLSWDDVVRPSDNTTHLWDLRRELKSTWWLLWPKTRARTCLVPWAKSWWSRQQDEMVQNKKPAGPDGGHLEIQVPSDLNSKYRSRGICSPLYLCRDALLRLRRSQLHVLHRLSSDGSRFSKSQTGNLKNGRISIKRIEVISFRSAGRSCKILGQRGSHLSHFSARFLSPSKYKAGGHQEVP